MRTTTLLAIAATTTTLALARSATDPEGWEDGRDLHHFVTRPDLTAPRYKVAKYHPDAIVDGYWFIAPYSTLYDQSDFKGRLEHISGQTGAHIYDGEGNLVWSAASQYHNRNVFNLQPIEVNETHHLTFHLSGSGLDDGTPKHSSQVFMDRGYKEVGRINEAARGGSIDFHAFKVLPGGENALTAMEWWWSSNDTDGQKGRPILNAGFAEVKLHDPGTAIFEWEAYQAGLDLSESYDEKGPQGEGYWDYIHENSVDKDANGDYYVSGRHTSTIYKVSGTDKRIVWRLGGKQSDFEMTDPKVVFHWQHHVRVRGLNATHTILSIFDNASDDHGRSSQIRDRTSAALIVLLDTVKMKASVLRRYERPDGGMSRKLGNVQQLDDRHIKDSSIFVDWAEQGHISEYDGKGRMVLEAKFMSPRMSSYRAYKYPWIGLPTEKPRCKILPISAAIAGHEVATAFYVSWNGATEVESWEFYGANEKRGSFEKLGSVNKTGFETSLIVPGVARFGYAMAISRNGTSLDRSNTVSLLPTSKGDLKLLSQVPGDLRAKVEQSKDAAKANSTQASQATQPDESFEAMSGNETVSDPEEESLFGSLVKPGNGTASEGNGTIPELEESNVKGQDSQGGSSNTSLIQSIALIVLLVFAVFGVYSLVKTLIPLSRRLRKGYSPLNQPNKQGDDQFLEARGRGSLEDGNVFRDSTEMEMEPAKQERNQAGRERSG